MKLAEYLRSSSITYRQFAAALGCDPAQVSRWVTGRRMPTMEMAARICRVTDGQVTPNDFLPTEATAAADAGRDAA